MSYSFSVRAATKKEALAQVEAELQKVLASQPQDRPSCDAALNTALAHVDVVPNDETHDVVVSVSGSVGWRGVLNSPEGIVITGVSSNVYAHLAART